MSSNETQTRTDNDVTALKFAAAIPSITLGRQLGQGGMAVVYEGLDRGFSPPRRVAVKLMGPGLSGDPEFRARFEREASMVADFRHDNIIHVYSSGEAAGTKYIVMEYLAGGTLTERIARGPLPAADAIKIGTALAQALAYSHTQGVVHRDFKPGNVLFAADSKPVLSDFGIAKPTFSSDAALTQHSMVIGAPRYMAPEQANGDQVTDRADIYSFGLTLFEMLTARMPEPRVRRSDNEDKEILDVIKPLSPTAATLICRCLQFDPTTRPSAIDCVRQLTAAAIEVESKSNIIASPSQPRNRLRHWLTGLAGTIMVAGGAAWVVLRGGSGTQSGARSIPAPVISANQIKALFALLGISEDAISHQQSYMNSDVINIIQRNSRRVTLGSNGAQIKAAFDLCNHYSKGCTLEMYSDETLRNATLLPFLLDSAAVTVGDFRKFVDVSKYLSDAEVAGIAYALDGNSKLTPFKGGSWRNAVTADQVDERAAVVGVSFRDAKMYCQWKQKRLPTEDEWEYVARGPERHVFPWGDDVAPALARSSIQPLASDGTKGGIGGAYYGMSGQIWEWVDTEIAGKKVLKGGSWLETNPANKRSAARRNQALLVPDPNGKLMPFADSVSGFRCAKTLSIWPDAEFWFPRS